MRNFFVTVLRVLLFIVAWPTMFAFAQTASVPELINYQGQLLDQNGDPLPTAEYSLAFSIYDADGSEGNDGSLIWGPKFYDDVPVVQGHFNILLGPQDDSPSARAITYVFNESARFLEITLVGVGAGGEDEVISPRQAILSAPFAMHAVGSVPVGGVVPYFGDLADLPENWAQCAGGAISDPDSPLWGRAIPDLRDRFIRGGTASNLLFTGGSDNHSHYAAGLNVSGGSTIVRTHPTYSPANRADQFDDSMENVSMDNCGSEPCESHRHSGDAAYGNTNSSYGAPPFQRLQYICRVK